VAVAVAQTASREIAQAIAPRELLRRYSRAGLLTIKDRSAVSKDGVNEFLETPKRFSFSRAGRGRID
jgi:hypothetical protein